MNMILPETWEIVKFHDIGEFLRGPFGSSVKKSVCVKRGPNTFKLYEQGNIIQNDFERGDYYVTEEQFKKLKKFELSSGDIVITCAGTLGRIAIVPTGIEKGIFNSVLMRIRPIKSRILPQYFLFYFQSSMVQDKILQRSSGATIKNLFQTKTLRDFEVPLPPIPIQQKIIDILQTAKSLKEKREQANQTANKLLEAVFIRMFGDPVVNPMQWSIGRIGDYAQIRYGTGSPPPYEVSGIPFIRATNIKKGQIVKKEMKFISSESASKIEKCKLVEGSLLIVRSGANTGDSAVVPIAYDGSYAAYDLIIEFNEKLNSIFVWTLLNMNYGRSIMKPLTKRAAQPHINAEQVSAIKVPVPPIELQQRFVAIIQKINNLQEKQEKAVQEISVLFNSLMSKAFKGEPVS